MDHITVIFVTENVQCFGDRRMVAMEYLAHPSDWGYTEVHAEIEANNVCYSAVGHPPSACVLKYSFRRRLESQPFVECVEIPVTNLKRAQQILESLSDNHATYRIPFMEFLVPTPFVKDVDLEPSHWGHLFCSQFVLLCLKRMRREGILALPADRLAHLDDCPTVTCTPSHLRHILDRVLPSHENH